MKNSKRCLISIRHEISLSKSMSPKSPKERANMDRIPYVSAIGSIMYVIICTRPDIVQALSVTSTLLVNKDIVTDESAWLGPRADVGNFWWECEG